MKIRLQLYRHLDNVGGQEGPVCEVDAAPDEAAAVVSAAAEEAPPSLAPRHRAPPVHRGLQVQVRSSRPRPVNPQCLVRAF